MVGSDFGRTSGTIEAATRFRWPPSIEDRHASPHADLSDGVYVIHQIKTAFNLGTAEGYRETQTGYKVCSSSVKKPPHKTICPVGECFPLIVKRLVGFPLTSKAQVR